MSRLELRILLLALKQPDFSLETKLAAASITLTEIRFRTLLHRLCEYAMVILLIFRKQDPGHLSIGISQISIRHFRQFLATDNLGALKAAMVHQSCLHVCCSLIDDTGARTIGEVAHKYNGRCSPYYLRALGTIHSRILNGERQLRLRSKA